MRLSLYYYYGQARALQHWSSEGKESGERNGRRSTLQGRERSVFNQTNNLLTLFRGHLGRLLKDGARRVWAFPSATMSSWAETELKSETGLQPALKSCSRSCSACANICRASSISNRSSINITIITTSSGIKRSRLVATAAAAVAVAAVVSDVVAAVVSAVVAAEAVEVAVEAAVTVVPLQQ